MGTILFLLQEQMFELRCDIKELSISAYVIKIIIEMIYLLFVSQASQSAAGLPVRNDPPRVLIRREEAHDAARDDITNVGENAPCFIHLSTNSHTYAAKLV